MNKLNRLSIFLGCIVIALSFVGCMHDLHKELGQPKPENVSTKWSQLKEGMNQNEVIALLGVPIQFKQTSNYLTWSYPFGTVTFTGASDKNMVGGTDGKLTSWKLR